MADSVRGFKLTIFSCLWIHICSHIQFDEYPRVTVCDGENANLIWKYTSNESISSVQWHKHSSPDVLMADIFFGFTAQGAYASRVTQATALGNAAITLSSVTAADNGTYKCSVNSNTVENRGYLIVVEAPSGLSYFNKTSNSLTCNPPQNEGTPKVRTVLKKDNGEILTSLTVQSSGTYHCCILGDAVKCLASTSNTSGEICVNETLNSTGPTTEPPGTTIHPKAHCDCPVLSCLKVNGFCVLWVIVILVGFGIIVLILILFKKCRKEEKQTKKEVEKNKLDEKQLETGSL